MNFVSSLSYPQSLCVYFLSLPECRRQSPPSPLPSPYLPQTQHATSLPPSPGTHREREDTFCYYAPLQAMSRHIQPISHPTNKLFFFERYQGLDFPANRSTRRNVVHTIFTLVPSFDPELRHSHLSAELTHEGLSPSSQTHQLYPPINTQQYSRFKGLKHPFKTAFVTLHHPKPPPTTTLPMCENSSFFPLYFECRKSLVPYTI